MQESWDLLLLGQNVVGTFGIWDNSLFFWDTYAKGIGTKCHWDNLPVGRKVLGQFSQDDLVIGTKGWMDISLSEKNSSGRTG